ncbi:MAG: tRNA-dihydrouridine synthase [Lentisphaerae bacterium]|nr:tRNA-dihydrouridine synthase [Lentisphaerota bacterium]
MELNEQAPGLKIGPLVLETRAILAPMAGYTDCVFRSLCFEQGCSLAFTEMTNAAGVVNGSPRTLYLLETCPGESLVGAHLYGSDPEVMARAAEKVAGLDRFALIDINCGCPVRRIVARGEGSALMGDPQRLAAIVSSVRESSGLPVTVKTRLGLSPETANIEEVARAAEDAGAAALFVHARAASQKHAGEADWQALARLKDVCTIPVIGNGGVVRADDGMAMLSQSGVDGLMIGRAAIGYPWIFRELNALLAGRPLPSPPTDGERLVVIRNHFEGLLSLKEKERHLRRRTRLSAERAAVRHFRAHLFRYMAGEQGVSDLRKRLGKAETPEKSMAVVSSVLERRTPDAP